MRGIRIDVAWETYEGLEGLLQGDGPSVCWPFSQGTILCDPSGKLAACLALAQQWFNDNPAVAKRIELEYAAAKQTQARRHAAQESGE